jgi:cytochrome c oxidase cbb3-type subunit 3
VTSARHLCATAVFGALLFVGCTAPHGQPREGSETLAPNEIADFPTLYTENCGGCHGLDGKGNAAMALANPVYLAIVDEASFRKAVAQGVRGTAMPAFAESSGGMLTDKQIDILASGIRSRWGQRGILDAAGPPSYAPKTAGNPQQGEVAYKTFCFRCHGEDGHGGPNGSAITDSSYLALVSDQGLRTVVITGRPDLGAPDWRGNVAGKPMSEQEVTDVVAWLISHRLKYPGQPHSVSQNPQPQERLDVR